MSPSHHMRDGFTLVPRGHFYLILCIVLTLSAVIQTPLLDRSSLRLPVLALLIVPCTAWQPCFWSTERLSRSLRSKRLWDRDSPISSYGFCLDTCLGQLSLEQKSSYYGSNE